MITPQRLLLLTATFLAIGLIAITTDVELVK